MLQRNSHFWDDERAGFEGGFKEVGTYPGAYVPNPLEVLEHFGDASDLDIAREILAHTKLNWNSAEFSSGFPITLEFAERVAEVLSELDDDRVRPNEKYRYYM